MYPHASDSTAPQNLSPAAVAWVERSLGRGSKIVRVVQSNATTSSTVFFLHVKTNLSMVECVLRLFTYKDWLADEPDLAEHEAAALITAHRAGLPVPELLAYSAQGAETGVPAVLMSLVDGQVDLKPSHFDGWLSQLAEMLVRIHQANPADFDWSYFSWVDRESLKLPAWSRCPAKWARVIEIGLGPVPVYKPVFVHRDYHPTNVLWQSGRLSGVVDWVNACRGPAGIDVAHCQRNLVNMFGVQTAERFLELYIQSAGPDFEYHPFWDIESLLDGLPMPGNYPPWQEYGLGPIALQALQSRQDDWLEVVLSKI